MAFRRPTGRLSPLTRSPLVRQFAAIGQAANRRRQSIHGRTPSHNLIALGCMLIAAGIWALVPLGVDVTGGANNPFFFNAGWRIGGVIGCLFVLLACFRGPLFILLTDRGSEARRAIGQSFGLGLRENRSDDQSNNNYGGWAVLYGVFGKFEYAIFAFAVGFASISTVTVIFTVWPIMFIIIMALLYKIDKRYENEDRYTHDGKLLFLMIVFCFIGFAFVVWPETVVAPGSTFYVGIAVAVVAALVAGSHNAVTLRWADKLGDDICNTSPFSNLRKEEDELRSIEEGNLSKGKGPLIGLHERLDIFSAVLVLLVTQLVCAVISIVIALMAGENVNYTLLILSIAGGFMSGGIADVLFRTSNIITTNLGVNAVIYAMPIFALLWLAIFSPASVIIARADYFIIGVLIIVVSNLLINSEAEVRRGFRGLVLTLGVCGTFVYFREDIFALIGLVQWHWSAGQYFAVVGMAATVFTLLLAFRVGRIISRTDAEENRIFLVFRKVNFLVKADVIDSKILDCVLVIDAPESSSDLNNAYLEARSYFRNADYSDGTNRELLIEAEADLDALVRSRQSAVVLGELFSLVIFGGITIFLVLFSRPQETAGWPRFMVDVFAMLIAPVIVFLMVNIWDLHDERNGKWLKSREDLDDYVVSVRVTGRRLANQWLSVILGVGIVAVYMGLLAHRWLGWFS